MRVGADGDAGADTDTDSVTRALEAFRAGDPVCVHDFADRVAHGHADQSTGVVAHVRDGRPVDGTGRIHDVRLALAVGDAFDLPFLADALDHPAVDDDPDYDDRSSFSLPVNHRETFTGITDADRARTIVELAGAAAAVDDDPAGYGPEDFAAEFRVPGHVHVLRGDHDGLAGRTGHTELGLAMAEAVGAAPAAVVCEMLDDETGAALTPADAEAYARRRRIPYVEGAALVEALK